MEVVLNYTGNSLDCGFGVQWPVRVIVRCALYWNEASSRRIASEWQLTVMVCNTNLSAWLYLVEVMTHCSTLETSYDVLQYNANSVITRLQSRFFRDLHPATVWTAGRDAWTSKTCIPVATHAQCVTRDGMAKVARSTLYMYVQRLSLQEGGGVNY